ncbi:MAG: chorismate mutase [Firmicutes bacterium]|nr:chorismate mutase [Bacillota bacterium]
MNLLEEARVEIDRIDREMAALYEQRMNAVINVVKYKKENGLPILDNSREALILEKNVKYIQNEEYKPFYKEFMTSVISNSKNYQATVLSTDVVAYAGVEGAFAHIASERIFPNNAKINFSSFEEVFEAVVNKKAQYGVIPFENTNSGLVGEVLDALLKYPVYIQKVVDQSIEQCLLGVPGSTLKDIEWVYSKDQALAQAKNFLKNLKVQTISYPNTAMAAQFVASQNDKTKAAIGAKEAAKLYGLEILADKIEANTTNTTRFLVIGLEEPKAGNHTSVIVTVKHCVGSLEKLINAISACGLNMASIQSRPIKGKPFEYFFFIEVEGVIDPTYERILKNACESIKVLGTYPLIGKKE